jgi:hypothetical protein
VRKFYQLLAIPAGSLDRRSFQCRYNERIPSQDPLEEIVELRLQHQYYVLCVLKNLWNLRDTSMRQSPSTQQFSSVFHALNSIKLVSLFMCFGNKKTIERLYCSCRPDLFLFLLTLRRPTSTIFFFLFFHGR